MAIVNEPGRSLGDAVMARVREGDAPAPRRFVWLTAAAAVVLCGDSLTIEPLTIEPLATSND
ncbi:MAG TPA: hypothetical protein VM115_01985 [Vicinamibacterales bacterium]|nr:hypothetical protein [Vicinamibacterales bacterium]